MRHVTVAIDDGIRVGCGGGEAVCFGRIGIFFLFPLFGLLLEEVQALSQPQEHDPSLQPRQQPLCH